MSDGIQGEVTYVLRNKDTGDIIQEHTQKNIITESFYTRLLNCWQLGFNIVATSAPMEASRYTNAFPGGDIAGVVTSFPSRVIPSIGVYSRYIAKDGVTPQYVQFSGRYDAPTLGTSRTVASIGLASRVTELNTNNPTTSPYTNSVYLRYDAGSAYGFTLQSVAFLKLTTPCVQTDLQVLDVYYRIFFPYTTGVFSNIPEFTYSRFVNEWTTSTSGLSSSGVVFPYRLPKPKVGDDGLSLTPYGVVYSLSAGYYNVNFGIGSGSTFGNRYYNYTDTNFTDNPGVMINSTLHWSNGTTISYYENLPQTNKIQNLIGIAAETNTPTVVSFLNVDNLPTGSGKVYLGGSWNNIGTPTSPGLYYTSVLPEYNRIKITTSGAIGVSQYKIVRQKFFGYIPKYSTKFASYYYTMARLLPPMSASGLSANGTTTPYDYNSNLIENVTETFFSVQQLSSSCRYDDSSFIFVKKNKIILYSIGAGDYWKINGSYTNIHQVAVVSNKIYIACRSTGLWVVDPYTNLTPASLASPASGIDLSICNGVAKGYGNMLWVVGNNCLASYDGTTWTKYDSTTTPAFNMAGVSDDNWSNIEYLKVDEDSVNNEMLLVRKYNATVNSTLLGVWWSTVGVATNTGAETTPSGANFGRPRVHRGQVAGLGGYWLVLVQNVWQRMAFGTTTFTALSNVTSYYPPVTNVYPSDAPRVVSNLFQSAVFIKDTTGQVRSWHADDGAGFGTDPSNNGAIWYGITSIQQKTINNTGGIVNTITAANSALCFSNNDLLSISNAIAVPTGINYAYLAGRTSTQAGYGGIGDMTHNFVLCPGVMVVINYNSYYNNSTSTAFTSVGTRITNFGMDYTDSGGAMAAYTAQQEYGWNGSQWILNGASGKPTHLTTDALFDGVTVRFEEGATGTSFVTPNLYKFGLSDGLLKDNATRATYTGSAYYFRKTTPGVTDLESSVVPSARAGQTGVVGINVAYASSNASLNLANEVVFPGQNLRQYAIGDKPLVGDFVVSIDVTNLNDTAIKNAACIGITRQDWANSGLSLFGFVCSAGTLYWYDGGTTGTIATISAGTTTSLEIRRTGSTITLWRNGTSVRTMSIASIGAGQLCLDIIRHVWDHVNCTYLPATGTRVPAVNITSNGTAVYVDLGNPSTNTGRYSNRFYGIDYITPNASTITMNSTLITPKTDGTAPSAGQISIDVMRGTAYFNSADIGKTISANYLVINS